MSLFLPKLTMRKKKKSTLKCFSRILLNVEEEFLEIHKHCSLSITWILKKIELHTNSEDHLEIKLHSLLPSAQNSYLTTRTLFVFYFILIIALSLFEFWDNENLVAPISSLTIHKILFSFSWFAVLTIILKSTLDRYLEQRTISGIFVQLSKNPPYCCPLEP